MDTMGHRDIHSRANRNNPNAIYLDVGLHPSRILPIYVFVLILVWILLIVGCDGLLNNLSRVECILDKWMNE